MSNCKDGLCFMQDLCGKLSNTYSAGVNSSTPFNCTEVALTSKYKSHFFPIAKQHNILSLKLLAMQREDIY